MRPILVIEMYGRLVTVPSDAWQIGRLRSVVFWSSAIVRWLKDWNRLSAVFQLSRSLMLIEQCRMP